MGVAGRRIPVLPVPPVLIERHDRTGRGGPASAERRPGRREKIVSGRSLSVAGMVAQSYRKLDDGSRRFPGMDVSEVSNG
jgi:hypothetical protein